MGTNFIDKRSFVEDDTSLNANSDTDGGVKEAVVTHNSGFRLPLTLPEIPQTWLIALILGGLIIIRGIGFDSWVTASLSSLIGYLTGRHITQNRQKC